MDGDGEGSVGKGQARVPGQGLADGAPLALIAGNGIRFAPLQMIDSEACPVIVSITYTSFNICFIWPDTEMQQKSQPKMCPG